ncbi:hypothetical protein [Methylotuvimicrobium sp. KM2]|uniref:hypothetical protein n=1 Tax=Methylotuvimicrobium sp. KM2 TaxID=3133976 RepID=UPI003100D16C
MFRFIFIAFALLSIASCSTALKVDPIASEYNNLSLKYYVENHGKDRRQLEKIIASELKDKGYDVSSGYKSERPVNADILITYDDRWQWDMSNYLIHMRIDLRDPETNVLLGTGSSYQTSLARENEGVVINKIISSMFGK